MKIKKILTLFLLLAFIFGVTSCGKKELSEAERIEAEATYIILTINPEVMLKLDKSGKVIDVISLNEDAVIFKQDDLKGLDIGKAMEKVVSVAKENGFLKKGSDGITVAILEEKENSSQHLNKLTKIIEENNIKIEKVTLSEEKLATVNQVKDDRLEEIKTGNTTTTTTTTTTSTTTTRTTTRTTTTTKRTTTKRPADFNLRTAKVNGMGSGYICTTLIEGVYEEDGSIFPGCGFDQNNSFFAIDINKVQYVTCIDMKTEACLGNPDLVNLSAPIKLTRINDYLSSAMISGVKHYFDSRMGEPLDEKLTADLCKKYKLSCAIW